MINLKYTFSSAALIAILFSACGSSDDTTTTNNNSSSNSNVSTTATLVDPYIIGAILCEDKNKNAICDVGEQISSATTSSGNFTFDDNLTVGSHIIIKTQGSHEGLIYDLNISGLVDSNGSISVVSPLTTFETKGLTASQIVIILNQARIDAIADGATNLSSFNADENTIFDNPMDGDLASKKVSEITNVGLSNLQASLASYGILQIINASDLKDLNSSALVNSGQNGGALNLISKNFLRVISDGMNTNLLTSIKTGIDSGRTSLVSNGIPSNLANTALPEPTMDMVIKVATKIIDTVVGTAVTTCKNTVGDTNAKISAALNAAQTKAATTATQSNITSMGNRLYGLKYKSIMTSTLSGSYSAGLTGIKNFNADLKIGIESQSNVITYKFDANGNIIEHTN